MSKSIAANVLRTDYEFMLNCIRSAKRQYPEGIDVRLCVEDDGQWLVRVGDESYDQRHSTFCGASFVNPTSNAQAVLEDLCNQVMDQIVDQEVL